MATFRQRALNEASMHKTGRFYVEEGPVSSYFGKNVLDLEKMKDYMSSKAYEAVQELKQEEADAAATADHVARAEAYCYRVIPAMEKLRGYVDAMEPITASKHWPFPSYGDMMFRV